MTDQPKPAQRPWRKFPRFSVRGLIVVVLVIGAGLGLIVRQTHVQRDAVAAITKTDGSVLYDWQWSNGKLNPQGNPGAPKWLVDLIGIDYFGHVTEATLTRKATDAELAQVGRLIRLQVLTLELSSVSDAGLSHLNGLTKLSELNLDSTHVTDAGLAHLKGLRTLEVLSLEKDRITDSGLVHLKGLTNLSRLGLDGTQVTDAGLVQLKGLTKLFRLGLRDTRVTDAGIRNLKQTLPGPGLW